MFTKFNEIINDLKIALEINDKDHTYYELRGVTKTIFTFLNNLFIHFPTILDNFPYLRARKLDQGRKSNK